MEALFNKWGNLVAKVRNDIVFEGKNKQYGAYYLRINYNKSMAFSLIISSSFFFALASLPSIVNHFDDAKEKIEPNLHTQVFVLPQPPVTKLIEIPKEIPDIQPEKQALKSVKFTAMKAVDEPSKENIDLAALKNKEKIGESTENGKEGFIEIPDGTKNTAIVKPEIETPLNYVKVMPSFPGGAEAMNEFIRNNVYYPQIEKEMGISGKCYVTFVVEKNGAITNIKILQEVPDGPGYSQSAINVIKKMPKWIPGKQNGDPVRVQFILPIYYTL